MKTTLLEGKVRVAINGKAALLTPGQQAVVNHKGSVDTHAG
ncbi:hypothetical protein [Paraflavitalea speifideaquila]|nr:hypothetical protein [Paraflavitalea speifideiaquila]